MNVPTKKTIYKRVGSKDLVRLRKPSFPVTLTNGGSSALLRKSAVESTTLAQLFCVNQAGRLAAASACAVCFCNFQLVGVTKL